MLIPQISISQATMQSISLQNLTQEFISWCNQTFPLRRALLQTQIKQMPYPRQSKKLARSARYLPMHLIRESLHTSKWGHLILGTMHDERRNGILARPEPRERADGSDGGR